MVFLAIEGVIRAILTIKSHGNGREFVQETTFDMRVDVRSKGVVGAWPHYLKSGLYSSIPNTERMQAMSKYHSRGVSTS